MPNQTVTVPNSGSTTYEFPNSYAYDDVVISVISSGGAGSVAITYAPPKADGQSSYTYSTPDGNSIDLTAIKPKRLDWLVESLKFTPSGASGNTVFQVTARSRGGA